MEIKPNTRHIRDIVTDARRRAFGLSILVSSVASICVWLGLAIYTSSYSPRPDHIVIAGTVGASILLGTLLVWLVAKKPLQIIIQAIIHTAGEATNTPPPNPEDATIKRAGLDVALKTIYGSPQAPQESKIVASQVGDEQLRSALDATNCGFVVFDQNHTIVYHNHAAPIAIDATGKQTLSLLFNGTDTLENWWRECEQHAVHEQHIWTRVPDRLPDVEGRRFFDVIASYDKGSEHEVVLSLIERTYVYASSEEDLDFIAFAAHELRGPITVIRGYLDVLEDELSSVLADDQHELFRRLTVSANRLSGYINNILNTSKYDRRHLKVHLSEERVGDIYEMIRDDMALRSSSQNRLLSVQIPDDLPTIAADKASVSEVFGNLIDNAIKYSNEGGAINVFAKVNGNMVDISVQDFGIGMPGNVVSNLFQKFYRSHRSRETVAGTGIGLYISKAIIESHGGHISVSSEEGKGSIFTVSLPIYATVAAQIAASQSNESLIEHGNGWIKNHNKIRG